MFISGIGITSNIANNIQFLFEKKFSKDVRLIASNELIDEEINRTKYDPKLRRADRFTKIAMSSVLKSIENSEILPKLYPSDKTGIILTSAHGAHSTTFAFLDEIISYGGKDSSPIKFSSSVHNAVTAYISISLGITGPTITLTQFSSPIFYGFMAAKAWLKTNTCENIILCHVDELNDIMRKALHMNEKEANKGSKCNLIEGAVSFLLTKERYSSSLCSVINIEEKGVGKKSVMGKESFKNYPLPITLKEVSGNEQIIEAVEIALLSYILKHDKNDMVNYYIEDECGKKLLTLETP